MVDAANTCRTVGVAQGTVRLVDAVIGSQTLDACMIRRAPTFSAYLAVVVNETGHAREPIWVADRSCCFAGRIACGRASVSRVPRVASVFALAFALALPLATAVRERAGAVGVQDA
jgi:hypothetical protein